MRPLKETNVNYAALRSGLVKGKRSSGYFALETITGEKVHASANVKKNAVRVSARTTTLIQKLESASNSSSR